MDEVTKRAEEVVNKNKHVMVEVSSQKVYYYRLRKFLNRKVKVSLIYLISTWILIFKGLHKVCKIL